MVLAASSVFISMKAWFFPFSIRRFVTFPKGSPREMTSPSVTSPGSLRRWITLEGAPVLLLSPLNFLLSFPFAGRRAPGKAQHLPGSQSRCQEGAIWLGRPHPRGGSPAEDALLLMIKGPLVTQAEKSSSDPRWKRRGRVGHCRVAGTTTLSSPPCDLQALMREHCCFSSLSDPWGAFPRWGTPLPSGTSARRPPRQVLDLLPPATWG